MRPFLLRPTAFLPYIDLEPGRHQLGIYQCDVGCCLR